MWRERAWTASVPALAALLLSACAKREEKAPPPPPPPVVTNGVAPAPPPAPEILVLPESVATIRGGDETPVKAPRSGYLVRQLYKDGADVREGEVLFILDAAGVMHSGPMDGAAFVKVSAPRAGVAGSAFHGGGDRINAGDELTTLAQIDTAVAELTLPDALAEKFSAYLSTPAAATSRQNIELILPDGSVYPREGIIADVTASGKTNTMRIHFPNPDHVLRPGEFVRVRGTATPAVSLPVSPVVR